MTVYAKDTAVSTEASRMEIERTLTRYKAESFAYGTEGRRASIMFRLNGRVVRFLLELPDREEKQFTTYKRGYTEHRREDSASAKLWEQACRQKWRALSLVIKAKLEAVSAGITTVEDEFLSHTLLPDGQTFGEWAKPEIDKAYRVGKMPSALALAAPAEPL